ncbi:MAG: glycosyltransferase family 4 protein [Neptuniibacter sp.]
MKLCIVRQQYRPDGGAERFISRALEQLSRQNLFDVSVITRNWQGDAQPGVEIIERNPEFKGRIAREISFAEAARETWQQQTFDLVQSHERIAGCDIYRAGDGVHREWLKQRARIMNPVAAWYLGYSKYHRYVLQAEKALFESEKLQAVICNSQMVRDEVISYFNIAPEKVQVIYNGIDTAKFSPCSRAIQNELRQTLQLPDRLTLLYVGSGFERKGLKTAIQALAESSVDAQLVVVGKDKRRPKYEKLAAKLNVADRIIFTGMQPDPKPYYQAADALIHPALYDPFPNVIHEAMASGLPVLTSTKSGGAEFITQAKQGFVADALDVRAFSGFIQQLTDTPLLQEMKLQAREFIEPYTIENCIQQYNDLYLTFCPAEQKTNPS